MNALILRTDGTREERKVKDDELPAILGCNYVERLPHLRGYRHPGDKQGTPLHYLSCWVDEEGMLRQRKSNGYAGVLMALNVQLSMGYALFGDVVIFSRSQAGKERAVDPYLVKLCQEYEDCEDEDEFFVALEELNSNKAPKNKTTSKKKVPKKKAASKKKKKASSSSASSSSASTDEEKKVAVDPTKKKKAAANYKGIDADGDKDWAANKKVKVVVESGPVSPPILDNNNNNNPDKEDDNPLVQEDNQMMEEDPVAKKIADWKKRQVCAKCGVDMIAAMEGRVEGFKEIFEGSVWSGGSNCASSIVCGRCKSTD
jgi:hypothetical protein